LTRQTPRRHPPIVEEGNTLEEQKTRLSDDYKKFKIEFGMEILIGILLIAAGGLFTYWGYKEDADAMGGLKYRKLITGIGLMFCGLIIILR
jgi:membrane-associated HD superfamily phosphohydrolase